MAQYADSAHRPALRRAFSPHRRTASPLGLRLMEHAAVRTRRVLAAFCLTLHEHPTRKAPSIMWFTDFYRTAVGKKALMAITGIVLYFYVLAHMLGNLKYFEGEEKLNAYADGLRHLGEPFLPYTGALWIVRVILALALGVHIAATIQLTIKNWKARPTVYLNQVPQASTFASRTMRWTGGIILVFIIFHLLHLTFGSVGLPYEPHDVYYNVRTGFENEWVALIYILAQIALGLHLYHGVWSLFQSLGWNHPRYNHWRRYLAWVSAFVIAGGNILIPLVVLLRKYS